jgi:hypothetical protein
MTLAAGWKYLALTAAWCTFLNQDAKAQDCRGFLQAARKEIGSHVVALQRHEHEASDRLKGLDTRPFDVVLADARETAAIIDNPASLKRDEGLDRCRNATRPVRAICAEAARALVEVLERYVANPKPDYDKPRFADTMAECEKLMDLKPLPSAIRGTG